MTLGNAAAARVRLIVFKACGHQVEPGFLVGQVKLHALTGWCQQAREAGRKNHPAEFHGKLMTPVKVAMLGGDAAP